MFNSPTRHGFSVTPRPMFNVMEEKMAAPNNAYYVLTEAHAGLPNSVLFDDEFDARLATKDTGDLSEGVNLYYTDARVGTYGDAAYLKLDGSNANANIDIGAYDFSCTNLTWPNNSNQIGEAFVSNNLAIQSTQDIVIKRNDLLFLFRASSFESDTVNIDLGSAIAPFGDLYLSGDIAVGGTVDGIDIAGNINQNVKTTGTPSFNQLTVDNLQLDGNTLSSIAGPLSITGNDINIVAGDIVPTITLSGRDVIFTEPDPNIILSGRDVRLTFQPVAAGHALMEFFTHEGDGGDYLGLGFWGKGLPASTANRERFLLYWNPAGYAELYTEASGTGTLRPFKLYTQGNTDQQVFLIDGGIKMSTLKSGVNQAGAGAAANELWIDTADNSVKRGV